MQPISADNPILIVGAGPVGLSLALALTRQGIPVHVFEQDAELNEEIRASTLHPATLEMLSAWGALDGVIEHGHKVRELAYWERSTRQRIATFHYDAIAKDTPFPYRLQCPQHILTRVLLPLVAQSPYGTVHMGHRLIAQTDHGDHVEAVFETLTGECKVSGTYLVGADGAHSAVRQQLGLSLTGLTYADRFLLVGTDYDFTQLFPDFGPVNYIFDPEEWVIILQLPDITRVVFRLTDEESAENALSESSLRRRMDRFVGRETPFNIITTQLYSVHQRVAETFRVGRVLLVGDAGHLNNPAGGMGMNSGIHDANMLVDAFVALQNGSADSMLDEYSEVRRRVALEGVQAYSEKNYRDLASDDPDYRQQRNHELAEIAADPAKMRAYLLRASMLNDRI